VSQLGKDYKDKTQNEQIAEAMANLQQMMDQGRSFSSHERKCCFLNTSSGRFATVSAVSGLDFADDGRAVAVVDWDQDGYPDLWISNRNAPRLRFMHNDHPHTNHFLAIKLQGNGAATNRDAIGARVEVVAKELNGKRLVKSLRAGEGFLSQSGKILTFGLGQLSSIDKITVRWPAGSTEEFPAVPIDHRYLLVQGSGKAEPVSLPARQLALKPGTQPTLPGVKGIRVPLVTPIPMPHDVKYKGFDGADHNLAFGNRKPMLVVLWASWCAPCQAELAELAAKEKEIRAAGIDVVLLAVDGQGEDGSTPQAAKTFYEQKRFPFAAGEAPEKFAQLLMGYHHMAVVLTRPLPIPASFLIDGKGRLSTVYKGTFTIEELLQDVARDPKNLRERWDQAACLPGSSLDHDSLYLSLKQMEVQTLNALGDLFAAGNQYHNALDPYRAALETDPESGEANQGMGQLLEHLGRWDEAAVHYRKALKIYPERAMLHHNLGNLLARSGKTNEAIACYKEAIRLDPNLIQAKQNLNRLEKAQGATPR
jgi:tetratricopeptide (TPR) repeat protein